VSPQEKPICGKCEPYPIVERSILEKNMPRVKRVSNPKEEYPKEKTKDVHDKEPTRRPAFSKKIELSVQHTAVNNEAISPMCDWKSIERLADLLFRDNGSQR
jgi:hypothetical protein